MNNKMVSLMAAGLLVGTLAGCSSDGSETPDAKGDSTSPSSSQSVDPGNVSPPNLPEVPVLKRERGGAIKDLSLGDCATDAGKQQVSGTITSSLKRPADYLVSVSWTTSAGDVMGRGFKLLKGVAPGAKQDFTIEAKVADGATQCVSGVVYGKA
jgi:hypothetical protein